MRVLVVGGGGREHALCWKLAQSPHCDTLYCAPGNGGIARIAELVPIAARETRQLTEWALAHSIGLTVIGPDDPLADGIVDAFQARGLSVFGPTRAAAQIEWSKSWAKELCRENDVPLPAYATFDDADQADRYVDSQPIGVVVKADGLAVGKGALVCPTHEEAHAAIDRMMRGHAFGASGSRVVIEELLKGRELSAFAISDGTTYRILPFACDHKAIFDGDTGPNTGGMGAYSPVHWLTDAQACEVELRAIAPTLRGLARAGRPYVGFLYGGLFLTATGLRVIEFNSRFGDPEAQVVLPRLDVDFLDLLTLATDGRLGELPLTLPIRDEASCCVVAASAGYPGDYRTGLPIDGLDACDPDAVVFHAGTRRDGDRYLTAGGRVLGVTGFGPGLARARGHAYANLERIRFDGMQYRRDIGR